MNQLDSELVLGALASEDYKPTESVQDADLVLLNTCSVREHAEDKVYSALGTLKRLKRKRPELVIGVVGCMAQMDREAILSKAPHVDLVLGPGQIDHLPAFVRQVLGGENGRRKVLATEQKEVRFARNIRARPDPNQAFVEVIRGCDVHCTFCVVPMTRGPEYSRRPEDVLAEVQALADDGVREVTLLGQTVDHYGKDFRNGYGLGELLRDVASIDGIVRVRFITSHPRYLDDRILAAISDTPKVCPYLHMPLQSGSDAVLARMKRKYDMARYRDRVARARETIPGVSIASDFIVGFPGETAEDFEASVRAILEFRFSNSFIFKYSPRPGTAAVEFPDDVPPEEKKRRNQVLLAVTNRVREEEHRSMLGSLVDVLVEGISKRDPAKYMGRTRTNHIVCFDGQPELVGQEVSVKLASATTLTLFGERTKAEATDIVRG
ncbi:MAG: tRNA (N6-isopentenyl adenosine(37)-C2)-methylthiotransferase MiaB [Planctomycetes bacterium]|nr:tRNA (N6-isopentenyl adenosine(37)-C2)-methylthiotransferase MiaB [Planctomycetota bacterium]